MNYEEMKRLIHLFENSVNMDDWRGALERLHALELLVLSEALKAADELDALRDKLANSATRTVRDG